MGMDPVVETGAHAYYNGLVRVFRLSGTYGPKITSLSAAVQGCSLSVLITNCVFAVWAKVIEQKTAEVSYSAFIDDAKAWSSIRHVDQLKTAWVLTNDFDEAIGQVVNGKKSVLFATSNSALKIAQKNITGLKHA